MFEILCIFARPSPRCAERKKETILRCPWNPDHNDRAAYVIQWRNGAVAAGCHHDGCKAAGNDWSKLKEHWGLVNADITAADIIFPASPAASQAIVLPRSASLETFFEPPQLRQEAFHGPLGENVLDFAKATEASPAAILSCLLMYFGNAVGRRFFIELDGRHFLKLFIALIGPTARGRKGTADRNAQQIIDSIDPAFSLYRHSGLSTGEGMLQVLQDSSDSGIPRPAVFAESEFASVMRRKERRGNTLDPYIRQAWDDVALAVSTKTDPVRIEGSHISLVVHITPGELQRLLSDTDVSNGFANRFIWCYSNRSRQLPGARSFDASRYPQQISRLRSAYDGLHDHHMRLGGGEMELPLDAAATEAWPELYCELDPDTDSEGLKRLTSYVSYQFLMSQPLSICTKLRTYEPGFATHERTQRSYEFNEVLPGQPPGVRDGSVWRGHFSSRGYLGGPGSLRFGSEVEPANIRV